MALDPAQGDNTVKTNLSPLKCPYCKANHKGVQVYIREDEHRHLVGPVTLKCRACGAEIDVLRVAFSKITK